MSPEEARRFFLDIVDDTLQGRFDWLCKKAANPPQCQNELQDLASLAPVQAPRIRRIDPAAVAVAPPSKRPLGQVIVVEGQDRRGRPFTTEVFVFRDEGQLVAKNILWWSQMGYSTEHLVTTAPKPPVRESQTAPPYANQ